MKRHNSPKPLLSGMAVVLVLGDGSCLVDLRIIGKSRQTVNPAFPA